MVSPEDFVSAEEDEVEVVVGAAGVDEEEEGVVVVKELPSLLLLPKDAVGGLSSVLRMKKGTSLLVSRDSRRRANGWLEGASSGLVLGRRRAPKGVSLVSSCCRVLHLLLLSSVEVLREVSVAASSSLGLVLQRLVEKLLGLYSSGAEVFLSASALVAALLLSSRGLAQRLVEKLEGLYSSGAEVFLSVSALVAALLLSSRGLDQRLVEKLEGLYSSGADLFLSVCVSVVSFLSSLGLAQRLVEKLLGLYSSASSLGLGRAQRLVEKLVGLYSSAAGAGFSSLSSLGLVLQRLVEKLVGLYSSMGGRSLRLGEIESGVLASSPGERRLE